MTGTLMLMTSTPGPSGAAAQVPRTASGLREGAVVGGYELVRRMGSGGMGVVWDAVDGGGRHVAIKVLHPHVASDPVSRSRLEREAAVLSRLKDERVARILDLEPVPEGDTPAFVVTELVDGPTLQHEVDHEGPYDPGHDAIELADLAHGLVGALQAVHEAGVIHRDLKPANVMLGPKGPVLIDFGIAQSEDDTRLTRTGQVTGTPGFIPPEMLDGGRPDPEVDRYACVGVILFALTGQAPFGAGPWQTVFRRVYDGVPELGDMPEKWPALAVAFTQALHPRVERRMRVEDLLTVLDEVADGGTGEWAVKEILGPDALGVDEEDTDTGSFPVLGYAGGAGSASPEAVPGTPAYGSAGYGAPSAAVAPSAAPARASGSVGRAVTPSEGASGQYGLYDSGDSLLPPAILPGQQYGAGTATARPSAQPYQAAPAASGGYGAPPVPGGYGASGGPGASGQLQAPYPGAAPAAASPYGAGVQGVPSAASGPVPSSAPSAGSAPYAVGSQWGDVGAAYPLSPAGAVQTGPSATLPQWAREPERCPGLTAVGGLLLVVLGLMRPILALVLLLVWEVLAGAVGRADNALRWRRLQQGRVDGDTTRHMWRSPLYLLTSLLVTLPGVLLGALGFMVSFMLLRSLAQVDKYIAGDMTLFQFYVRSALMFAGVTGVVILITWFVPWGRSMRQGSALMLNAAVPKGAPRVALALVAVLLAALALVLLSRGYLPEVSLFPIGAR